MYEYKNPIIKVGYVGFEQAWYQVNYRKAFWFD